MFKNYNFGDSKAILLHVKFFFFLNVGNIKFIFKKTLGVEIFLVGIWIFS